MSLGPAPTGGWRLLVAALRRSAAGLARPPRAAEASGRLVERFARAIELRSALLEGPSFAALAPAAAAAARAAPGDAQAAGGRQSAARRRDDRGAWGAEDGATKGGRPNTRATFPAVPSGTRPTRARAEAGLAAASAAPAAASRRGPATASPREGARPPSGAAANDEELAPVISLARAAGRARTLPGAAAGNPGGRRFAAGVSPLRADATPRPVTQPSPRTGTGGGRVGAELLAALVDELAPRRRGRRPAAGTERVRQEGSTPAGSIAGRPQRAARDARSFQPLGGGVLRPFGAEEERAEDERFGGLVGGPAPREGSAIASPGEPTPPAPGGPRPPLVELPFPAGSRPLRAERDLPDRERPAASPSSSFPDASPTAPPSPIVPIALDGNELADLVAEALAEQARLCGVELP